MMGVEKVQQFVRDGEAPATAVRQTVDEDRSRGQRRNCQKRALEVLKRLSPDLVNVEGVSDLFDRRRAGEALGQLIVDRRCQRFGPVPYLFNRHATEVERWRNTGACQIYPPFAFMLLRRDCIMSSRIWRSVSPRSFAWRNILAAGEEVYAKDDAEQIVCGLGDAAWQVAAE